MFITAVIQARLGSSRLNRKILLPINGQTILQRVIGIVRKANTVTEICVVCNDDDGTVENICKTEKVIFSDFKPEKRDVLAEFWHAKKWQDEDIIVRITSDCVLLNPEEIDKVVVSHIKNCADYSYNRCDEPDKDPLEGEGQDVEVFSGRMLRIANELAVESYDREHCTPFMRNGRFIVNKTQTPKTFGCSINTIEDYYKILGVINRECT